MHGCASGSCKYTKYHSVERVQIDSYVHLLQLHGSRCVVCDFMWQVNLTGLAAKARTTCVLN
jgi:hypothetical protein